MAKPAIFALLENETAARSAVAALEKAGFIPTDISILSSSAYYDPDGVMQDGFAKTREVGHTNSTKAPEGATTGVAAGGALGGLAGWLVGAGVVAFPGAAALIAAGPILALLSGAAVGATAGGMVGAMIGYGIPEFEAKLYAGKLGSGHILIGVHAVNADEAEAAKTALTNAGARDIKVTAEVADK